MSIPTPGESISCSPVYGPFSTITSSDFSIHQFKFLAVDRIWNKICIWEQIRRLREFLQFKYAPGCLCHRSGSRSSSVPRCKRILWIRVPWRCQWCVIRLLTPLYLHRAEPLVPISRCANCVLIDPSVTNFAGCVWNPAGLFALDGHNCRDLLPKKSAEQMLTLSTYTFPTIRLASPLYVYSPQNPE